MPCDQRTQTHLGLELDDFTGPWETCQPIGHAAWFLEFAGVLAPSATGAGLTLALFEHRTTAPHQNRSTSKHPNP